MVKIKIRRHLVKTISYRIISSSIGFIVLWVATGSVSTGAFFSISELLYKPIVYFVHERIFYKFVKYGLKEESGISEKKNRKIP